MLLPGCALSWDLGQVHFGFCWTQVVCTSSCLTTFSTSIRFGCLSFCYFSVLLFFQRKWGWVPHTCKHSHKILWNGPWNCGCGLVKCLNCMWFSQMGYDIDQVWRAMRFKILHHPFKKGSYAEFLLLASLLQCNMHLGGQKLIKFLCSVK